MLCCAAETEGFETSVATTRRKLAASGTVKLPLPQYSSSRSHSLHVLDMFSAWQLS